MRSFFLLFVLKRRFCRCLCDNPMRNSKTLYGFGAALILLALSIWMAPRVLSFTSKGASEPSVFVAPTPKQTVAVHVIFPSGPSAPGLSHYAEHLAWLNTVGRGDRTASLHSNAWASDRATGYWLSGPPDDLPKILRTLSGLFNPIDLASVFAEQERNIILREYNLRIAGNADALASEAMRAFLYDGNSLAISVIATPEKIMAIEYADARNFHETTHTPDKATLVVTGDVTQRQVRQALRDVDWPDGNTAKPDIAPEPFDLAEPAEAAFEYPDANAAPRLLWRRVVALPEPIPYDLLEAHTALLRDILDTNQPGGLAGPLRFDAAIARNFGIHIWPIDEDNIKVSFTASPGTGVLLTDLRAAFETTLAQIATDGIPQETFTRVHTRFENFWPEWDDEDQATRWMAEYVLNRASELRVPASERAVKSLYDDLSFETTNALLQRIAGEGRTAIAFIGPEVTFQ